MKILVMLTLILLVKLLISAVVYKTAIKKKVTDKHLVDWKFRRVRYSSGARIIFSESDKVSVIVPHFKRFCYVVELHWMNNKEF